MAWDAYVWICLGGIALGEPVDGPGGGMAWKLVDVTVPDSAYPGANGMARECHLHLLFSRVFKCLP